MTAPLVSPGAIVRSGLCIGCGACAAGEPQARMEWDRFGQLKPTGPAAWMDTPTEAFSATCPFSPRAEDEDSIAARAFPDAPMLDDRIGRHVSAHVGAAVEAPFRERGSSGGMVS